MEFGLTEIPKCKSVVYLSKNCEGIKNSCGTDKNHYFIVISKNKYNRKSKRLRAVPITSLQNVAGDTKYFALNYGVDISKEDFNSIKNPLDGRKSVVLIDRLCAIEKDIDIQEDEIFVSLDKYNEIVNAISNFVKTGDK